jgi:hypothetical protein
METLNPNPRRAQPAHGGPSLPAWKLSDKCRMKIAYPSGISLSATGVLYQLTDPEMQFAPAVEQGRALHVLDPRAVVIEAQSGRVLYSPRSIPLNRQAPWVIAWLAEHPGWDNQGEHEDRI